MLLIKKQSGFSSNEMIVVVISIGILATMTFPNFFPVIEIAEVLIAEKYLLGAVKECQTGLINGEVFPVYTIPPEKVGLDFLRNRNFQFPYTGDSGECFSSYGGNILSAARISSNSDEEMSNYSLNINVITGEKTSEGIVPSWLDWWEGVYSPIIPENDPLLY